MKLAKREYRFSHKERKAHRTLKSYTKQQRERKVLDADAKPEHGVAQEMPKNAKNDNSVGACEVS